MIVGAETRRWTRRRWIGTVTCVLAVQVTAVALLVRPTPQPPVRPGFATRVQLVLPEVMDRVAGDLYPVVDPAVLALPSLHGFSGSAWLRYPLLELKVADHAVPPEWLGLTSATLGRELSRYLATNVLAPPLSVDAPLPSVLRYEASFAGEPVALSSRLRVHGELAGRAIIGTNALPSWPHTEIISNTVIRAAVDAVGQTFSATLLARSGLQTADDYAVWFVENAHFARRVEEPGRLFRRDELGWGTFVFLWHTLPPPSTNVPPELP